MSDVLGDIILKNLVNLGLDESFNDQNAKPMVPRLNRSSSYFSPTPKPHSVSSEQLSDGTPNWSFDIWGDAVPSKPQNPFRPDRSMSLTENSIATFGKPKPLEVPPPPGFPPLTPQTPIPSNRYKTELCRSFQENGSCKYGNKCQFAHGEAELRCMYRHPKYKTEACRTFYNFGYCPYGTRCHFIHEDKLSSSMLNQKNQTPRLRQSVSFAGFLGSRSSPPPALHEPLSFTRAPSVSPPPSDLLSPVFNETFQFGQTRASVGDIHNIPMIVEPQKNTRCVCGHGNNHPSALNKNYAMDDRNSVYFPQPNLQRFSSEDSLSDRESYSSSSSNSGSTSPTFDGSGGKRLTVFARLSVSD
ncbi:hypothetical protein AALO_G00204680 [Alosa alosa]|uniref:mRNA decay activator protein ZFP36 n=1 Tax=Alosa alosa TaxID=278164 RepID=A0AAV6G3Z6_9TELE|nr:mRNA decay activator protein ZFP36 [Alosa sapidissima]XP_048119763.1 mRNA decay activator protein ZFP36 [Alosa alosa]KAG5269670.1 hypothetical protein AALO_G00204680 [Alosa alosa]